MKVLIVGSGGREHALAWKIRQSQEVTQVYAIPGNDGMRSHAECLKLSTHEDILAFVKKQQIDLTIIGQEVYLVNGLADQLEAAGFKVFGPSAAAAKLEGSKSFSKDFMKRHQIPTAAYETFTAVQPAENFLKTMSPPYVIKADGLAAGKGVLIAQTLQDAQKNIRDILENKAFGDAGNRVVIEEFLSGEEASCFVITDGKDFVLCPFAQDHKRIGELDTGLNTGGMGAYVPAPVVTPSIEQRVIEEIVKPTLAGMAEEGRPYKGVLYIGLMIENGQARVVEYNCRFGDPECQPLLMCLKSDLLPLTLAAARADGSLAKLAIVWHDTAAACVILASGGYPETYEKGKIIAGIAQEHPQEAAGAWCIFHAGTRLDGPVYRTNGGRVLGVTAIAPTLEKALNQAYKVISTIHWEGMTYRRDIGLKGLLAGYQSRPKKSVGIVIGSQSDVELARKATAILEQFKVGYALSITSAHRTPERTREFIRKCEADGVEVFIAMAGLAAHLPGVVAAETLKPVIGVPIDVALQGLDSLLSIAQMPPGIPVLTMSINGAVNAAITAIQILSLQYADLRARLKLYRMEMRHKIETAHRVALAESD